MCLLTAVTSEVILTASEVNVYYLLPSSVEHHEGRRGAAAAALGAGLPAAAALLAAPAAPAAALVAPAAPSLLLRAADAAGGVGAGGGDDGLGGRAGAGQLRKALAQGGGVALGEAGSTLTWGC